MIDLTSPYLWYISRATGSVSLVLLTLVVVLGILIANRVGGKAVGRFEISELHRMVSMSAVIFIALHVVATVIDSYVPTGLISSVVPMSSSYRRIPVAVGAVALDLLIAVWVTSLVQEKMRNVTWRLIHWLSYPMYAAAVLHGFLTGSDSHQRWWLLLTGISCLVFLGALTWRWWQRPSRADGRTALSPLPGSGLSTQSTRRARQVDRPVPRRKRY